MLHVKNKTKSIISLLLALAIVLSSLAVIPASEALAGEAVTVKLNKKYQTIRGFGGINLPEWVGSDMTTAQVNKAFGNGTDDLGLSILRIYVSDDRNQWYRALATAKTAIENGAIVFASPWNPPSSMTETFTRTYTEWNGEIKTQYDQRRLRHDKYDDYAKHLNDFVTYMKDNGVDLYAISMQNEPDYAHEWTWWTSDECVEFLANYADQINCRVISPETFSYNKEYYNKILNNSAAYNNTDIFGTHFYGTPRYNMDFPTLENCGKEIWMTEVYVPNSETNSADRWPEAIQVSENIHNGLVVGNMNAYVWWYIRRGYGPMKEDGTISKRGYCMAQYSKFVRPGDVRVAATECPENNVYVSAYKGDDNRAVIVVVNKSTTGYSEHFSIANTEVKSVDRYRTSANENLALTSDLKCDASGFWSYLPAESVSTFVVTLGASTGSDSDEDMDTDSATPTAQVYFNSTFENSVDDWGGRGSADVLMSGRIPYSGTNALLVQNRTAAWNGAAKNLDTSVFKLGNTYSFGAKVTYVDGDESQTFYMKLQYTDASGSTIYATVATANVTKGSYATLQNTNYTIPQDAQNPVLYIETASGSNNFYIDSVYGATAGYIQ